MLVFSLYGRPNMPLCYKDSWRGPFQIGFFTMKIYNLHPSVLQLQYDPAKVCHIFAIKTQFFSRVNSIK